MKKMYVTITGCVYRYGLAVFKPGMTVTLIKEPENKYDREAIRVEVEGLGIVGYIANSPKTVRGTSMSAGRLYDKIGGKVKATVDFILPDSVICSVDGEVSGYSSEDDSIPEKLPAEEEFLSHSRTADLDLYTQEDTSYLVPEAAEAQTDTAVSPSEPSDHFSRQEALTSETEPDYAPPVSEQEPVNESPGPENSDDIPEPEPASEQEGKETEALETAPTKSEVADDAADDSEKTLSPEEIASMLSAALAGLTAEAGEDPDADYIYGNQTPAPSPEDLGNVLAQNIGELTTENIGAALNGSTGLSAADFVNVLTGGTGSSAPQAPDSEAVYETPASAAEEQVFTSTPTSDDPVREDRVSNTPGLNFNSARFPEEEEGYVAPSRESLTPSYETVSDSIPDTEEIDSDAISPAVSESADDSVTPVNEEIPPVSESAEEVAPEEEESADDITKPLVYDESELDENLAQLHLGDIDATYLSDSFLDNLKKSLRESS